MLKTLKNVPNLQYVNLSQSTSEQMINGKYLGKKTPDDIIKMTKEAVECAVDKGAKLSELTQKMCQEAILII